MNRRALFLLSFSLFLSPALFAQEDEEPAAAPDTPAMVEFNKEKQEYRTKEFDLDQELLPSIEEAKKKYGMYLAETFAKAEKDDDDEVPVLKEEVERFRKAGLNSGVSEKLPASVRKKWTDMTDAVAKLTQGMTSKRLSVRAAYLGKLDASRKAFAAEQNAAGMEAAKLMRAVVMLRTSVESNQLTMVGTEDRALNVKDLATEGGYLIGFEAGTGSWHNTQVMGHLAAIYRTAEGETTGRQVYGEAPLSTKAIAKPGYAVGGLAVKYWGHEGIGYVIGTMQVTFMKINPDGLSLDPKDSYKSDWIGASKDTEGKLKEFTTEGKLAVGIRCRHGEVVDSIALLRQK